LNCSFSGGLNSIFAQEGNFRIVGNVFIGFSGTAAVAKGVAGTLSRKVRVSANSFAGNAVAGGTGTVQSFSSAITATDAAIQVDDNLMLNVKTGILVIKCSGNVSRNEFTSAQIGMDFSDSPGVLVEQNDFSTSAAVAAAFNAQGLTTAGMRLIRSGNATVRNNTFAGGNGGIVVTQQSAGVTIDANFVRNMIASSLGGGSGIVLTLNSSAEIHNNNIENNAFGLSVFGSTANATNNWWGAANGPSGAGGGSGSSISAGVPFAPFLTAPNPNAGA
ncbi:MAG: right-handed parallel beta-helix repeat-containing protein, partial [Blastocatellia bacterium]